MTPHQSPPDGPTSFVTRSLGGLSWAFAIIGVALVGAAYVNFAQRDDVVKLDCVASADEGCVVTYPDGETDRIPPFSLPEIIETGGAHTLRFGPQLELRLQTKKNAERFRDAVKNHQDTSVARHEVFDVSKPPTLAVPLAGVGLALLLLFVMRRGAYRFTRDDQRGVIRIERARGFVKSSVVEIPLADIIEVAPRSYQPGQAFSRYEVVVRTASGGEVVAFPTRLVEGDAIAIAREASSLLFGPEEGPYPEEGAPTQEGAYAEEGQYAEEGAYPEDGQYAEEGAYPEDGQYAEEGAYPEDGQYGEEGAYPEDGGPLAEEGAPQEGAIAEEGAVPEGPAPEQVAVAGQDAVAKDDPVKKDPKPPA